MCAHIFIATRRRGLVFSESQTPSRRDRGRQPRCAKQIVRFSEETSTSFIRYCLRMVNSHLSGQRPFGRIFSNVFPQFVPIGPSGPLTTIQRTAQPLDRATPLVPSEPRRHVKRPLKYTILTTPLFQLRVQQVCELEIGRPEPRSLYIRSPF